MDEFRRTSAKRKKTWAPLRNLAANEAGVETAGDGGIGGAFDDGATVWKDRHFKRLTPEFEDEVVMPDLAMRREAKCEFGEIKGPMPLVNLNRVSAAECDMRAAFARQVDEVALIAAAAALSRARN